MPMQRSEFARSVRDYEKAKLRAMCVFIAVALLASILTPMSLPRGIASEERGWPGIALQAAVYVFLIGVWVGGMFLHARSVARARRDLDLLCPACHQEYDIDMAMASGRCACCNATIVEGEPAVHAGRKRQPIQRPDLESRRSKFTRAQDTTMMGVVVLVFFVVLARAVWEVLSHWNSIRAGSPNAGSVGTLDIVETAILGIAAALVAWSVRWSPRRHGLTCPNCEAGLVSLTMAAGRCGRCGAIVVEGEPALRDESQRQAELAKERRWFRWVATAGVVLCLFLTCLSIAAVMCRKWLDNELPDWFWPVAESLLSTSLRAVTVVGIFIGVSLLLRFHLRRSRTPRCPNCQAPVVTRMKQLATVTGRCGRCGAVVVEGAPAPPIAKTD